MNIREISRANEAAGLNFFEEETLAFFNSMVHPTVFEGPGGIFFVTQERYDLRYPILFTVRQFFPESGKIHTLGRFQQYETQEEAYSAARDAAR